MHSILHTITYIQQTEELIQTTEQYIHTYIQTS